MKTVNKEDLQWDTPPVAKEIKPIELTGEISPEMFGLEPVKAQEMVSGLSTVIAEREVLKKSYKDIIELSADAPENQPVFKELRLKIVKNRTQGIEKWHKTNKAFYLAGGRFVDAIKNKEIVENEQMEEKLLAAEKYFENIEKEKIAALKLERETAIAPFVDIIPTGLEALELDVWDAFFEAKKTAYADRLEAERKEAERVEAERKAEAERIEAQRIENERLRKEAAEKEEALEIERKKQAEILAAQQAEAEARLAAERAEAAKKMEAERKERARIEAELQAKKDAELKAERERKEAEEKAHKEAEKAAKAPVKKQLTVWVESFELPHLRTEHESAIEIKAKFEAFKQWSLNQINNL